MNELLEMTQPELQDRLELINGKMNELSHKIKNTSALDPTMEYLIGKLERLEKEKKAIEGILEKEEI